MFIHERKHWTDFTFDAERLSNRIAEANKAIGFLMGRLSTIGFDSQMAASVENITHDVVFSSEIEGVILNTDEVRSSVARKLGVDIPDSREPTHHVDGMVEMMLDAIMNFDEPLTKERLFGWHQALFPNGKSGIKDITVGAFRKGGMQVVSGNFGHERVHYRAPEAEKVEQEMEQFLQWFNDKGTVPSLVKSAIAHLWFVSIHPFDDGNGRMARALSDMILSQIDRSQQRFFSVSMQINKEKKSYYEVLERTQRGNSDITEWLQWYLSCIQHAAEKSGHLLSGVLNKSVFWNNHSDLPLSERQHKVLNLYLDGYDAKLTTKNWARLTEVSTDTAGRDIKDLIEKGVLTPAKGKVRDVSYNIEYVRPDIIPSDFSEAKLTDKNGKLYLSACYKGTKRLEDLLSDIDRLRYEQNEITLDSLLYKYFAYILS